MSSSRDDRDDNQPVYTVKPDPIRQLAEVDVIKLLHQYESCYQTLAEEETRYRRITEIIKKWVNGIFNRTHTISTYFSHGELYILNEVLMKLGQTNVKKEIERKTHEDLHRRKEFSLLTPA